jgi:two-component system, OmpR family, response regulator RegX3
VAGRIRHLRPFARPEQFGTQLANRKSVIGIEWMPGLAARGGSAVLGSLRPTGRALPGRALLGHHDPQRAGLLARALNDAGLDPTLAFDRSRVLACLDHYGFDLVVLDTVLGEPRPAALVAAVLARTEAPVVALGDETVDAGDLFRAGIHGFVSDDATPSDVAARAAALVGLRTLPDCPRELRWGPLELELGSRRARWRGEPLQVTPTELRILTALVLSNGTVVTSRELSRWVWGTAVVEDGERVFSHVRRVRSKIEGDPSHPEFLVTVRGEGFRLAEQAPAAAAARSRPHAKDRALRRRVIRRGAPPIPTAAAGR